MSNKTGIPTKSARNKIHKLADKWRAQLLLNEWYFNFEYLKEDSNNTYAHIVVNEKYVEARIYMYPMFWRASPEKQEEILVHELCHCFTQRIYNLMIDQSNYKMVTQETATHEWELLTQRIANVALVRHSNNQG